MDAPGLSWPAIEALRSNFTVDEDQQAHLERCWSRQTCDGCLRADDCSWCPFTWSCVPNSYKIPMLAPAYDENICPHWAERWEIRTQPLGCHVSTITSLASIVSVVAALKAVLVVFVIVAAAARLRACIKAKRRKAGGAWGPSWRGTRRRRSAEERDPLLPRRREGRRSIGGS